LSVFLSDGFFPLTLLSFTSNLCREWKFDGGRNDRPPALPTRIFVYTHKSRGVSLPGVEPYTDLASLSRRFLSLGFSTAQALTLREIRRMYIEPRELQRIAQLEMLDEVEELELVLDHYAISWGLRFPDESSAHESSDAWGLVRKDQLGNEEDHDG
jgi:hypothetical protein